MPDVLTKKQRSYNMSMIKKSGTKPELKLRNSLKLLGFSYQPKGIFGTPDFADKNRKIAIFIDGCFWHKCGVHYISPKSNIKYWKTKIERNTKRDKTVNRELKARGWKVIRIWEHQTRHPNLILRKYNLKRYKKQ